MRARTFFTAFSLLATGAVSAVACGGVEQKDQAPTNITELASSTCQSCFLHRGKLTCWGNAPGEDKPTGKPAQVTLPGVPTAIAVGNDHVCALVFEDGVYCWGLNESGQLGVPIPDPDPAAPILTPQKSKLSSLVTKLVAGDGYTCGLLNGAVKCMGGNIAGTLGNGDFSKSVDPIGVPGLTQVIDLAAGYSHTCVIDATNDVYCWGSNDSGQAGQDPGEGVVMNAKQVMGIPKADKLILGADTSCAHMLDGTTWCWGSSKSDQFIDMGPNDGKPRQVTGLDAYKQYAFGKSRTFGLKPVGTVDYWGLELASSPSGNVPPEGINGVNNVTLISAGNNHGCGQSVESIYCWGDNTCNQLGGVAGTISSIPVLVL